MFINDEWNSWTIKSEEIPFKSKEGGIGDGENKLGIEYGVKPLGQNTTYDLDIDLYNEKWEVKKLDSDNSFRMGIGINSSYREVINCVLKIVEHLLVIEKSLIGSGTELIKDIKACIKKVKSISGRTTTYLIDGLRKNEVSASNLEKANFIIEVIKKYIIKDEKKVSMYSSFDGSKQEYSSFVAFNKLRYEAIPLEHKLSLLGGSDFYNRLLITNIIGSDIDIFRDSTLKEVLNSLVRDSFSSIKLVLVHEEKGYKPITNLESIYCNRITSGNPRCKIV